MKRRVGCRAFCNIIFASIILSMSSIFIDADHWYAYVMHWEEGRWFHYSIASNHVVFVLYCVCWSLIVLAFAVRWGVVKCQ